LNTAFNGDTITDSHVVLNEGVIAYVAVAADLCTWQDVRERPDSRAVADRLGLDDC
jgi:hypothetical protein